MNLINTHVSNGVATLQMNSPRNLNALNESMLNALIGAIDQCERDQSVKVVVISGSGKGFSGGGDIGAMLKSIKTGDVDFAATMKTLEEAALRIRSIKKPVVASLHGPVAGAGFNLALLCDFRIAARNSKFIQAFVNIGLVPDMGGIFLLTRMLGISKATDLVMTGRAIGTEEAFDLGLVNQVVADEELETATAEFASRLCEKPSIALAHMKTMINNIAFEGLESSLGQEAMYQIECTKTEDFVEGITAFAEKRKAQFKGQ